MNKLASIVLNWIGGGKTPIPIRFLKSVDVPGNAPVNQIQSDWNQNDDTKVDYIRNKPTITTIPQKNILNILSFSDNDESIQNALERLMINNQLATFQNLSDLQVLYTYISVIYGDGYINLPITYYFTSQDTIIIKAGYNDSEDSKYCIDISLNNYLGNNSHIKFYEL